MVISQSDFYEAFEFEDDYIGEVGNLTLNPSNTSFVSGLVGQAVDFDGTAHIEINESLNSITNYNADWSILIRLKLDTTAGRFYGGSDGGSGSRQWINQVNAMKISSAADTAADWRVDPSPTLTTATWYDVVLTFDKDSGGEMKLYINNSLNATDSTGTLADYYPTNQPVLGALNSGTIGSFINGIIDCFYIFNKTLDSTEVSDLFNGGSGNQKTYADYANNVSDKKLMILGGII